YGVRALELLRGLGVETHLVLSQAAAITVAQETKYAIADIRALADVVHDRAVLDPHHVRDRDRRDDLAGDARRRRGVEGAAAPRPDGARDAAASRPSQDHDAADRNGRGGCAAGARLL